METETKERIIDWNHVYLLGWYGKDGRYLSTYDGTVMDNYITVVVTGPDVQQWGVPIWFSPANCKPNSYGFPSHHYTEYQLHEVKAGEDADEKAKELGGVEAIGWYIEQGFERRWGD
ncbi:unnamed protein product [marine sediment metagenome]|uniref:Uncharacterized protein n=1 Tax=marine sediment metagenome TaxID=412755 RepID=X1H150_9ZZZZ